MFLNASSTLVESKAEVSMNERVFFSEDKNTKQFEQVIDLRPVSMFFKYVVHATV